MGYLELPQVEVPHGRLTNNLLNNRNVYILDCYLDVYVWYERRRYDVHRVSLIHLFSQVC